ncbi:hypothetical protein SAMN05216588_12180 [Pseudomonas flavescens]|uniref:Uncharacterized protein n=1 Tax=Phytopseudomonas flavescens TaxID=29435 RepID=A0A1G8MEU8_9GAMM|nr:hypothetical protein [Pseudomonas flavescens]SDI66503.1 hypothetical protein SAMN05216588_12180 [Pseudomonas flavescens]
MYLVAVVTLICASCMLFLIAQAVHSGVAVSMPRGGPSVVYPLVTRPLGFYLHLLLYSGSAALFLGFAWLCLRVSRIG